MQWILLLRVWRYLPGTYPKLNYRLIVQLLRHLKLLSLRLIFQNDFNCQGTVGYTFRLQFFPKNKIPRGSQDLLTPLTHFSLEPPILKQWNVKFYRNLNLIPEWNSLLELWRVLTSAHSTSSMTRLHTWDFKSRIVINLLLKTKILIYCALLNKFYFRLRAKIFIMNFI